MSSALHQGSARIVQTAPANPLPAPGTIGVMALTVADDVTADLDWTSIKGRSFRILHVWAVKTGGTAAASANTVQVQTLAGVPISNALNMQVADQVVVHATAIDDASHVIADAIGLRVRRTKAGQDASCIVYIAFALL